MADRFDPRATDRLRAGSINAQTGVPSAAFDAGLRSYMLSIYNYMTSGILLTGIVALLFAQSGMAAQIMFGPGLMKYVIIFSPLAIVFAIGCFLAPFFASQRVILPELVGEDETTVAQANAVIEHDVQAYQLADARQQRDRFLPRRRGRRVEPRHGGGIGRAPSG